jgi:hypothetical protein
MIVEWENVEERVHAHLINELRQLPDPLGEQNRNSDRILIIFLLKHFVLRELQIEYTMNVSHC